VIRLDAATVLLQWATGGLLFLWVTTRRREVGIGYGWLLRSVYGMMAAGAFVAGRPVNPDAVRDTCSLLVALAAAAALVVSVVRRKAGVAGERARRERRAARVQAMAGGEADVASSDAATPAGPQSEFPPVLDLVAPVIGTIGLMAAATGAGGPHALAIFRTLAGAAFLGAVSDAMLLGHWYLVQPGLGREPLNELIRWLAVTWPVEVVSLLWPVGMVSVFSGRVDDGWNGTLGWFWVACAVTTIVLCFVTRAALKERSYSAVMAATGLLYLAILTAFGTDLVARAVLAG
jgi:heme exporter protein D